MSKEELCGKRPIVYPGRNISLESQKDSCVHFGAACVDCSKPVYAKEHKSRSHPGLVAIWVLAKGEEPMRAFENVPEQMAFEFTKLLRYVAEGRITRQIYACEIAQWAAKLRGQ